MIDMLTFIVSAEIVRDAGILLLNMPRYARYAGALRAYAAAAHKTDAVLMRQSRTRRRAGRCLGALQSSFLPHDACRRRCHFCLFVTTKMAISSAL